MNFFTKHLNYNILILSFLFGVLMPVFVYYYKYGWNFDCLSAPIIISIAGSLTMLMGHTPISYKLPKVVIVTYFIVFTYFIMILYTYPSLPCSTPQTIIRVGGNGSLK